MPNPTLLGAAAAFLSVLAGSAQAADTAPQTVTVEMTSFRYSPAVLRLEHGRAYRLHFVNRAGGGHDFTAPAFFAAADIAAGDRGRIRKGGVSLEGHGETSLSLTAPAAGRYKVHCSHFMHSTLGMTGEIIVL